MWYLSHFTNTVLLEPCKILFILIHLLLSRKTKQGILTKRHLPLFSSFLLCSMSCEANTDRLQFRGFLTLWLPIRFRQWEIQGHELQGKEKVEVFLFLSSSCQMMVLAVAAFFYLHPWLLSWWLFSFCGSFSLIPGTASSLLLSAVTRPLLSQ